MIVRLNLKDNTPHFIKMEFKLLDFNLYERPKNDSDSEDNEPRPFIIQMFGLNESGNSVSIFIDDFKPFFYIKVGDDWDQNTKIAFVSHIKTKIGDYFAGMISKTKLIEKKKLYGFDAGKLHKFVYIEFINTQGFHKVKNLWFKYNQDKQETQLNKTAMKFRNIYTEIYESNIPPLLRFFHVKEISPSGWIKIVNTNKNKFKLVHQNQISCCDYEFQCSVGNIRPINDKETSVPYKIMSFDIEASSSHGDFPIPKKDYQKLASNIMEYIESKEVKSNELEIVLKKIIHAAFDFQNLEFIQKVYTKKKKITLKEIDLLIDKWINYQYDDDEFSNRNENSIENLFIKLNDEEEIEGNIYSNFRSKFTKIPGKYNVDQLLFHSDRKRDSKVSLLNKSLREIFPPLEGDKVTFIGSTFQKYGEKEPYLNHCLALNSCDQIPGALNTEVESMSSEKDLLLAWKDLVQREQPDIIIGYNIFSFDYMFMFIRAKECNCLEDFLQLSRNKEEICGKMNEYGVWEIEKSKTIVASGTHELNYIKMNGRIQVDMYNWFRKTENLSSYKLDFVASHFIGDYTTDIEIDQPNYKTKIFSKNLTGLSIDNYIHFELQNHSTDIYKNNAKFKVIDVNKDEKWFCIEGIENPQANKVKWGLAKDDVSPKDIFRLTNEGPKERSLIAKYCIQDCNLVHHLFNKVDVITDIVEMSKLCSVPLSFLILRGQGIKLTSYVAKKCREKNTLMPVIDKGNDDGYEGAIVLDPKCDLYLDTPVGVGDFASLYPSSMLSENLCPSSKVSAKTFDLEGNLIHTEGEAKYDNLTEYEYVDVRFDTYKYVRKSEKSKKEKIKNGHKICRFAQFKDGKAIMPSILEELLGARKATRKLIPQQSDEFMKNVLDKRQLAYKVTANSLYGQLGAPTSSFYEPDIAASTTATGRLLLTFAKKIVEECYQNKELEINGRKITTNAEYIYGDTDSVFFNFNLKDSISKQPIVGKEALELSILIAQEACELVSSFLKAPHDFEYEKTFMPFCLLSKKRYVGILYETDPNKGKRKEMGIVLKRRDNAPIVKDIYGGVIDILMKEQNVKRSIEFVKENLEKIVNGNVSRDKLIITKSLNGYYANPKQIAHKVLADRIGDRESGNKPSSGDRIPYIYIVNENKKALQGEKIETPSYIEENDLEIDYSFYISNQIMEPLLQLYGIIIEEIWKEQNKTLKLRQFKKDIEAIKLKYPDAVKQEEYIEKLKKKEVKALLFDRYLRETNNKKVGNQSILRFVK